MKKQDGIEYQDCLAITLGLVFGYIYFKEDILVYLAAIIALASLLSFTIAKNISFIWKKLAFLLGLVVPQILLSLIYFLILTPIAILSRTFGKNSIQLKANSSSQFIERTKSYKKVDFEKSW